MARKGGLRAGPPCEAFTLEEKTRCHRRVQEIEKVPKTEVGVLSNSERGWGHPYRTIGGSDPVPLPVPVFSVGAKYEGSVFGSGRPVALLPVGDYESFRFWMLRDETHERTRAVAK